MVTVVTGAALLIGGVASAAPLPLSSVATTMQAAEVAATTTVLAVSPVSPAGDPSTVETLTATLTPASAAGSMQFSDGDTALGDPVPVTGGTATTTVTLSSGEHSLTAVFTPDDATAFSESTSDTVDYTVNGGHRSQHSTGGDKRGTKANRGLFGGIQGGRDLFGALKGILGGHRGILGGLEGFLGNLGSTVRH
ncbi:MAG TPA: Ig-like domain-containing protein [Pseudonocardiaceae bacterium]|nr:Ig-like domain-containing protein [Pseudonocardiaceae bacterium]